MTPQDVKHLAHLARIEITDEEASGYTKDFDAILGYVKQIDDAVATDIATNYREVNKAREDENPNETGLCTEKLFGGAPESQDGFYKVPKIL